MGHQAAYQPFAVVEAATGQAAAYGADRWTAAARAGLSEVFEREVDVFPVSTGSAANALALAALVPPWGSVLCHRDAHIDNDECGAPSLFTGGAALTTLDGAHSKIDPDLLRAAVARGAGDVHRVQPSALSLTQATETGSVYTVEEVVECADIARAGGLRVHMDGARFANAVAALGCSPAELTWRAGVDVLSFGATKNGAMTADAIVVFDRALSSELSFRVKRGAQLTSKMRFQSAQIAALVADDRWLATAAHANAMAARLREGLGALPGLSPLDAGAGQVQANMVFCTLPAHVITALQERGYSFYSDRWAPGVVRFVTSFATTPADVDHLIGSARATLPR